MRELIARLVEEVALCGKAGRYCILHSLLSMFFEHSQDNTLFISA